MITHSGQIWMMVEPADMRRGIDGLSMIVQQALGYSPCSGSAFVFCNRAGNRIKVLLWESGYANADYIKAGLCGRSWRIVVLS